MKSQAEIVQDIESMIAHATARSELFTMHPHMAEGLFVGLIYAWAAATESEVNLQAQVTRHLHELVRERVNEIARETGRDTTVAYRLADALHWKHAQAEAAQLVALEYAAIWRRLTNVVERLGSLAGADV